LPEEIIVIDDCSTDNSMAVLKRYPIRIEKTEENSGPTKPRNIGVSFAKGNLIAWLDADDFWDNNHLSTLIELVEKYYDEASVFWLGKSKVKQTKANAFVERVRKETKIRLSFISTLETSTSYGMQDRKETQILDAAIYQNAFNELESAIFLRSEQ
jgi:glycosyltransferase involved in cell wall biosynthesis